MGFFWYKMGFFGTRGGGGCIPTHLVIHCALVSPIVHSGLCMCNGWVLHSIAKSIGVLLAGACQLVHVEWLNRVTAAKV